MKSIFSGQAAVRFQVDETRPGRGAQVAGHEWLLVLVSNMKADKGDLWSSPCICKSMHLQLSIKTKPQLSRFFPNFIPLINKVSLI